MKSSMMGKSKLYKTEAIFIENGAISGHILHSWHQIHTMYLLTATAWPPGGSSTVCTVSTVHI